jgi:hypothetical protein
MTRLRRLALLVAAIVATAGIGSITAQAQRAAELPRCQEDAVLIGTGAFDAGRWSAYVCGPAVDDYKETPR